MLGNAVWHSPDQSFPKLATSDAELEATYRFLNNPRVTPEGILAPHYRATLERASARPTILAVHDTTTFLFDGEERRPGLGWIKGEGQGFLGHFAMAVAADGSRAPLGLLGLETIFREVRGRMRRTKNWRERFSDPAKERLRWLRVMMQVEDRVRGVVSPIHVMDREADSFELLAMMHGQGGRFVVRATYDRRLAGTRKGHIIKASHLLAKSRDVLQREVPLSRRISRKRSGQTNRIFPPRKARIATLKVRSAQITLQRQAGSHYEHLPRTVGPLNVVLVRETGAPAGEQPVEWRLLTTEPVDTPAQVAAVIDYYRARWVIEDYFKALKTGCAFTKRQLENRAAMVNALALLAPVAWRLLLIRSFARSDATMPAARVLTPLQVRLLKWRSKRVALPSSPTVYEAMLAIAGIGGHLRRNGEPGWQTLGRGLEELLLLEAGWAARDEM